VAPSGVVTATFQQPSDINSVAFFIAANADSRRSVTFPDVSSAVIKNTMGGPPFRFVGQCGKEYGKVKGAGRHYSGAPSSPTAG